MKTHKKVYYKKDNKKIGEIKYIFCEFNKNICETTNQNNIEEEILEKEKTYIANKEDFNKLNDTEATMLKSSNIQNMLGLSSQEYEDSEESQFLKPFKIPGLLGLSNQIKIHVNILIKCLTLLNEIKTLTKSVQQQTRLLMKTNVIDLRRLLKNLQKQKRRSNLRTPGRRRKREKKA